MVILNHVRTYVVHVQAEDESAAKLKAVVGHQSCDGEDCFITVVPGVLFEPGADVPRGFHEYLDRSTKKRGD
jgi:hypothetical protein